MFLAGTGSRRRSRTQRGADLREGPWSTKTEFIAEPIERRPREECT
jgi:hypothetical protein